MVAGVIAGLTHCFGSVVPLHSQLHVWSFQKESEQVKVAGAAAVVGVAQVVGHENLQRVVSHDGAAHGVPVGITTGATQVVGLHSHAQV